MTFDTFTKLPVSAEGAGQRAAAGDDLPAGSPPSNLAAEQALLGAILYDNQVLADVQQRLDLKPEHFYDPLHGRIFEAAATLIGQGRLASPQILKNYFAEHKELDAIGGDTYLAFLVSETPGAAAALDYAREIFNLHLRRGLIRIGEETARDARQFHVGEDPREHLEAAEGKLFALGEQGVYRRGFLSFHEALEEAVASASAAYQRDGHLAGLSTGLDDLDRKLGGLHPSDLVILAGRPSMGKSSLALNIAYNAARARMLAQAGEDRGGRVGFFSLEMSSEQLAMRILADVSGIPSDRIRRGDITPADYALMTEAKQTIAALPLHIDDTGGLPIAALSTRARRLKRQVGLDLLVVDYLQLVGASQRKIGDGRVQEVSEVTQGLKALAKDLNVPVLALAQLSRQVEARDDKRPQLADLRESGSIEQDADVVMFVYREEYYLGRKRPPDGDPKLFEWQEQMEQASGKAELIIGKQRHGPIGSVDLHFDERLTRFSDVAKPERMPDGR
jgi:replicative DNA helicase